MSGHLIVDGYNLGRSGELPLDSDPVSQEGRNELCELLSRYSREKGLKLTIVFDGRSAGYPERSHTAFKGGTVVFSSRSESADDVIRDFGRTAQAGTIVVTSDRGLAGTLSSRNIITVSCEEFAGRVHDHWMENLKGAAEEDRNHHGSWQKKGEGHRVKKRERKRIKNLKKL